jgi:hypothetical protein
MAHPGCWCGRAVCGSGKSAPVLGLALNEATARSCRIGAADRARPGHHDRKAAPDSGLILPVTCLPGG